jgi:hypothetical protein
MVPKVRQHKGYHVQTEANVEIDPKSELAMILDHGAAHQRAKHCPWQGAEIEEGLDSATKPVRNEFRRRGESAIVSNCSGRKSATHASC